MSQNTGLCRMLKGKKRLKFIADGLNRHIFASENKKTGSLG